MDHRLAQEQIELRRAEAIARYPALWSQMTAAWQANTPVDRLWLLYSANYLVRTGNTRWAIDPVTLANRMPQAPEAPASSLRGLSFILLTHSHADHLDLALIQQLRDLPIRWVIPQALLSWVARSIPLPPERVVIPQFGQSITLEGVEILPFEGIHWQPGNPGVPSVGYLATFGGKRWLFPGDVRTYDAALLPSFGPVDGLFAHLWLGRASALLDEPPLLEDFCHFCIDLQPKRVVITHLEELGRQAEDYWEARHCQQALQRMRQLAPDIAVTCARMGDCVEL